ncbi:AMP-binding protein [Lactobacillus amylovorus]|jgi:acyl-CoA synthetase|uniref:class I adenylate-forming enzyme family protein n=1 Tax=Lactobacillus amylovorus TaxID=1604 RepID=UPI00313E29FF|nr:AMP-binding protein [Lactobacillus amylovorus]
MNVPVYAPPTLKKLWQDRVNETPDKNFLIENDKKYTYKEIDSLVDEKIKELKHLKIQKGDLIALQFELDVENIVTILACLKLETVINPLNPHFDIDEITNLVERFRPYAIISQKALRGRDIFCNIDHLNSYSSYNKGDLKYFIRNERKTVFQNYENNFNSSVLVLNTSGTSGLPKGVVLTNQNILEAEYSYNEAFRISKEDMILMPSGMYHAIGFHHGLISTIIAGSTMVIMRHYNVKQMAQLINKYPISYIDSLPTVMYDILFKIKSLGHLRQLICGGDKIKDTLLRQAKVRHIPLYNCYGLTEAVPFSYTPAKYYSEHAGMTTAVRPIESVEVRIVNEKGEIVQPNKKGTIEVKGPVVFKEYLLQPEKTKDAFDHGWFNTGDIVHYTTDGLIEIDGRNSDMIIRGGENIAAHAVEEKIRQCEDIEDVAVLGIPDLRLGQRIGAFIVLYKDHHDFSKDILLSKLKNNNVDKKLWPEKIWVVEELPKTANGKIKKYLLRKLAKG